MEQQQQYSVQQLAEQKNYKAAKDHFRNSIKTRSDKQRANKEARRKNGNDGITCAIVAQEGKVLRHLFIAYHQFRRANSTYRKILMQPKPLLNGTPGYDQELVDRLIKEHAEGTVHFNQG